MLHSIRRHYGKYPGVSCYVTQYEKTLWKPFSCVMSHSIRRRHGNHSHHTDCSLQSDVIKDVQRNAMCYTEWQVNHQSETIVNHQSETIVNHQPETIVNHQSETIVNHQPETIVNHQPETIVNHAVNAQLQIHMLIILYLLNQLIVN